MELKDAITYDVAEHFVSINGEGPLSGQLAVFIRFKGCNLSCLYCDTAWANKEDAGSLAMTADEIYRMVTETGITNVTLTGGEPLYRPHMVQLVGLLASDPSLHIEIETNGSIDLSPFAELEHRPSFTMDYKLGASGMEGAMITDNFKLMNDTDCVKFVTGSLDDCRRARDIISLYDLTAHCRVFLSPVFGKIKPSVIADFMKEEHMNHVNLQLQLHKIIWAPGTEGV